MSDTEDFAAMFEASLKAKRVERVADQGMFKLAAAGWASCRYFSLPRTPQHRHDRRRRSGLDAAQDLESVSFVQRDVARVR